MTQTFCFSLVMSLNQNQLRYHKEVYMHFSEDGIHNLDSKGDKYRSEKMY